MLDKCWQCFGEGHLGSACVDDMCHGGDIPCMHDDESELRCDVCGGTGTLSGTDFEDDELDIDEAHDSREDLSR